VQIELCDGRGYQGSGEMTISSERPCVDLYRRDAERSEAVDVGGGLDVAFDDGHS
jgi:hypothetical protein